jgi:DNA-binding MarR family transcriptional regulator
MAMSDATGVLRDVVHQRTRLGILTIALEVRSVKFGYLREALDLTAGNLGGHLNVLEDAGLIRVAKGFEGRRSSTTISITPTGRRALRAEIDALKSIVERVERAEAAQAGGHEPGARAPRLRGRLEPI